VKARTFNQLLKKIRKNRDALTKIYNYFYPLIVIHINRSFRGKLDGNDIAQQFFLKLLDMEIKEYINHPASWVYRISEYIAIGFLRKQNRRKTAETQAAIRDEIYAPDETYTIENTKEILDCLDEKHRKIMYLHYWEGYTLIEISNDMNINYSTLKSMHTRAKNVLREKIKKE
jgi:RNA polymerase sigma-70 factor (ECF subfamily)